MEEPNDAAAAPEISEQLSPETRAKYFVAASLLAGEDYAVINEKPLCDTLFLSDLYDYIIECRNQGVKPSADMLYTVCPNAAESEYSAIIDVDFGKSRYKQNAQYFAECYELIVKEKLRRKRDELLAK